MKSQTTKRITAAIALCALTLPLTARADIDLGPAINNLLGTVTDYLDEKLSESMESQFLRVTNKSNQPMNVVWQAAGCAGLAHGEAIVCHSTTINANASADYTYKKGTSSRNIIVKYEKQDKRVASDRCEGYKNTGVYEFKYGKADLEFNAGCRSGSFSALGQLASGANSATDRDYVLRVRNDRNDMVTVFFSSARCNESLQGAKNVCTSMLTPPGGTAQLVVSKKNLPSRAVVGFISESRKDGNVVALRALESGVISGNNITVQK